MKRTTLSVREDIAKAVRVEALRSGESFQAMTDKLLALAILNDFPKNPTPLQKGAPMKIMKVSKSEMAAING